MSFKATAGQGKIFLLVLANQITSRRHKLSGVPP